VNWDAIGTWLGIVLSVLGFAIAFWQLHKTRSAAEAAERAAAETTERLVRQVRQREVARLLRELASLAREIDVSQRAKRWNAIGDLFSDWTEIEGSFRGISELVRNEYAPATSEAIEHGRAAILVAKAAVHGPPSKVKKFTTPGFVALDNVRSAARADFVRIEEGIL
jgi:hypothetical protein